MEGFFGLLKRVRVNRKRSLALDGARSDVLDSIERFHNPRMRRRRDARDVAFRSLAQACVERG